MHAVQRVLVGVPRVGHFLHDKYFHLLLKIEQAAKLRWLGFLRADAVAKVGEIGAADHECGARHHAPPILPKNHAPQQTAVDLRGMQRG